MGLKMDYYSYLCGLAGLVESSRIATVLDDINYTWRNPLDENRAEAGKNLRRKFANSEGLEINDIRVGECSVLEMLVAVSVELAETYDNYSEDWFSEIADNLGIVGCSCEKIRFIITKWLIGDYDKHGNGTPFPLTNDEKDCRTMQLHDQMNAYLNESDPQDDSWID